MAYRCIEESDEKVWATRPGRGRTGFVASIYRANTQRVMSLTFEGKGGKK
jgi:hypothetical protein